MFHRNRLSAPSRHCCVLLVVGACLTAHGQGTVAKRDLIWSQPGIEIQDPQFSQDGKFIVFTTRVHWPDGDEAESLPESFFKKMEARKRISPRFADPEIRAIDLNGNTVCEIRYGTHPQLSADDRKIVFAHQKKPLTGLRPVADTLAGNEIQEFDCTGKRLRTVAEPSSGYLDTPIFLPEGQSVAYTRNEAVNGAFGGPVELAEVGLVAGSPRNLLTRSSTPAVPCPPLGATKSDLEAAMCSQPSNLSAAFPDLILGWGVTNEQLVVLEGKPLPEPGDMYLASKYVLRLFSLLPRQEILLSMGNADMSALWDTSLQPLANGNVMIFSQYWKSFSVDKKTWNPDLGPHNTNKTSIYSPDSRYYLATEPEGEPNHFALYRVAGGKKLMSMPKATVVYQATWSRDSRRFAVIVSPTSSTARAHREDLIIYSLQ